MRGLSGARPVVITGMGVMSASGDRPEALFGAICRGETSFAAPGGIPADAAPGCVAAAIRDFAPERYIRTGNIRPLDRAGRLALVGVELALADSGWTMEMRQTQPIGLVVGTMFSGVRTIGEFDRRAQQAGPEYASPLDFSNTVLNAAAGQVAIWQRLRGINSTVAAGTASGVLAIAYAAQLVSTGRADVLLVGGVEDLSFESFFGFSRARRLATPRDGRPARPAPFDARRNGTALGEASAFLVLEPEPQARDRGAAIHGRIAGAAAGFDPDVLTGRAPDGDTLARTIARAVTESGTTNIAAVSSSASGSVPLDTAEAAALQAAAGRETPVTAIKGATGETLGASGVLQAIALLLSLRAQCLPGITGLEEPDAAVRLNISSSPRPIAGSCGLVTALTSEGHCAALVLAN